MVFIVREIVAAMYYLCLRKKKKTYWKVFSSAPLGTGTKMPPAPMLVVSRSNNSEMRVTEAAGSFSCMVTAQDNPTIPAPTTATWGDIVGYRTVVGDEEDGSVY